MSYKYTPTTNDLIPGNNPNAGAWGAWGTDAHIDTTYEPQRLNNFEFVITSSDFRNLVFPGTTSSDGVIIQDTNPSETIRLAVKSMFIPHFQQEPIEVKRGNTTLKYAGSASYNSGGNLVLHDFIGSNAGAVLMAWQNLSFNPATEKVGLASEYKKTCQLIEYTPDYQVVRRWKLYGCWISNIEEQGFDYESNNGTNSITATIQFDKAQIVQDVPAGF